jgi:hypothetical protein
VDKMSGIDEQVRCTCGCKVLVFGTTNSINYPFDIVYNGTDVYMTPRASDCTERIGSKFAISAMKQLYRQMCENMRDYIWHCNVCKTHYNKYHKIYSALVDKVGESVDEWDSIGE